MEFSLNFNTNKHCLGGSNPVRVCNDTDTGIGIGDTEISLPTPIPIRGIADMTILKKDNYYAFAAAEEPLSPYLEVTEYTKHYLQMAMFVSTTSSIDIGIGIGTTCYPTVTFDLLLFTFDLCPVTEAEDEISFDPGTCYPTVTFDLLLFTFDL